jgi:excisionase family DNA binding protein
VKEEMWISVKEASKLLGVTKRSVLRQIKNGKYRAKQIKGFGGTQYRICLSSIPRTDSKPVSVISPCATISREIAMIGTHYAEITRSLQKILTAMEEVNKR